MRMRLAVLLASGPILLAADAPPALPGWMAGCWTEARGERWFEECWTAPRGGIMIGSGRSGKGDKLGSWESMQIVVEPEAGMAFYGAPEGKGRTRFALQPGDSGGLTFVNAGHDYPQRVRYWREGDNLLAEVALIDGSKAMRWRYRRQGAPE